MNLGQQIRKGAKWLAIGNIGGRVLQFAFGIVLARLLMPADFGMIVTVAVFTGFVGMVTTGGMGQALIRAKEVNEDDFNAVFTLQLVIGALTYSGFFFAAPWFAEYFEDPTYTGLMRVSALFFLIRPFTYMRVSWLNREMQFKKRSVVGIITGIISGVASISMAFAGMGVWSLALSGVADFLVRNFLLSRITPLKLRLSFNLQTMRRHSSYGSKVVANDFLAHVRRESIKLLLSKLAGASFLGLFNKADSLHVLPFQMIGQPVAQPLFRAMSSVQDDLDKTKYMFHRVITLFGVYVLPLYVGLWWIAEPFIGVVYGEKWLPAAEPLRILAMASLLYIVMRPCGVVLLAQNRLLQEMIAQVFILIFTLGACLIGLNWGLVGVAWGFLASQVFSTILLYMLVYRTLPIRIRDLLNALTPGVLLNSLLFLALVVTHFVSGDLLETGPALYLFLMAFVGGAVYLTAFLFLPIPALATETERLRQKIGSWSS
jgi:O-antigen/teichoic acid export membrane protein